MKISWTHSQEEAISIRDKNILVAAAAGSGKTAVLVERIISLIRGVNDIREETFERCPVDKMLIVTFTKAAAGEMKAKIRKALKKAIVQSSNQTEKRALKRELENLYQAQISTFHSFALNVIRQYFYMIEDLEPSFKLADETQNQLIKEQCLDQLIEEKFQENSQEFRDFLDCYTDGRNFESLKKRILEYYNYIINLPNYESELSQLIDNLSMTEEEFLKWDKVDFLWEKTQKKAEEALEAFKEAAEILESEKITKYYESMELDRVRNAEDILEGAKERDWEKVASNCFLRTVTYKPSPKSNPEEAEKYEEIKEEVKELRDIGQDAIKEITKMFVASTAGRGGGKAGLSLKDQLAEMTQVKPMTEYFAGLIMEFHSRFKTAKSEQNMIDFNDIEQMCLKLLENEEVRETYKRKFKYIFIDEYQDTSLLQESIIKAIATEKNLFMVGDVKQSIYKFRNAEPEIFMDKYEKYKNGLIENSIKIDLNENFRSQESILDCVNYTFQDIMKGYDDEARLYPGNLGERPLYQPELFLLKTSDSEISSEEEDALKELKSAEAEALLIHKIIKETLGKPYYDAKENKMKSVEMKDIVILSKTLKTFGTPIYKTLMDKGLNVHINNSDGYFDTLEIRIFVNLLKILDNRMQDLPLLSVLHSEIFDFSYEELAIVRGSTRKKASYYESFMDFQEIQGYEDKTYKALEIKVEETIETLNRWEDLINTMELSDFVWEILSQSNYYILAGAMVGGSQRQANLRALVDKAIEFEGYGEATLYGFLSYLSRLEDNRNLSTGESKVLGEDSNVIRMMTIHKSKGLEFPVVILAGFNKAPNRIKGPLIHKDLGMTLDLCNYNQGWIKSTLMSRLINLKKSVEEEEENLRVLYVALTRPTNYLFVTGYDDGKKKTGSFLDVTHWPCKTHIIPTNSLLEKNKKERFIEINPKDAKIYRGKIDDSKKDEIIHKIQFSYEEKHSKYKKVKSKYSVSELNLAKEDAIAEIELESLKSSCETLLKPKFLREERRLSPAEKGIIYHGIMEKIDFLKALVEREGYLEKMWDFFIKSGIFTVEEMSAVNPEKILKLLDSNLGNRMVEAFKTNRLWREKPFVLKGDYLGEEILTQGIIDCYFKEKDENGEEFFVLIDYKTNALYGDGIEEKSKALGEKYKIQMGIYSRALEEAYGIPVKEQYLYLFKIDKEIAVKI